MDDASLSRRRVLDVGNCWRLSVSVKVYNDNTSLPVTSIFPAKCAYCWRWLGPADLLPPLVGCYPVHIEVYTRAKIGENYCRGGYSYPSHFVFEVLYKKTQSMNYTYDAYNICICDHRFN